MTETGTVGDSGVDPSDRDGDGMTPTPTAAPADSPKTNGGGSELSLVTFAGAAASGLGILGFVTFAGGVVLWRRFSEMGVPGDDAVALVPKSVLLSTGADFLVPALGLSALTVLGLVVFRSFRVERKWLILLWSVMSGVVVGGVGVYMALEAQSQIREPAFVVLIGIAGGCGIVVAIAFQRIHNVAAAALIAFVAAGTFWVARAYEKTSHDPTVIPIAYTRAQRGDPLVAGKGFLIAETADRIWFASLSQSSANELREIPRDEILDLELGQVTSLAKGAGRAQLFLTNLCFEVSQLATAAAAQHRPSVGIPIGCPAGKPVAHHTHSKSRSRSNTSRTTSRAA